MDNYLMIKKLKDAGISFDEGLSDEEFAKIEATLGFHFPSEIRSFLANGLPVGDLFFNWRDLSAVNIRKFHSFYSCMDNAFLFDLENNFDDLIAFRDNKFSGITDREMYSKAILDYLHQSTRLIPFYGHRCFFDGMDHMPIISFWQPVDSIFYGENFEDYLEIEFLGKCHGINQIPDRMKDTGIWYYLIG